VKFINTDGMAFIGPGAAIDLRARGRYAKRVAITATGAAEIAALRALVALLESRQISGR
jgi:hypothetical protein